MLIFIPTYILLAFASWSALAFPFSGSNENGNGHVKFFRSFLADLHIAAPRLAARKRSLSSSIRMARDDGHDAMDCGPNSKSDSKSTSLGNMGSDPTIVSIPKNYNYPTPTSTGVLPAIAKRRFHGHKAVKPSIFERDDPSASSDPTENPITVGDIVARYLQQRAASRKRASRPRTSRGYN